MKKVVLGLSGGIDSAVCAVLLGKQGLDVHALYLDGGITPATDAQTCADALNIPLTVMDTTQLMEREVCMPFSAAYLRGETPNPCILCNPAVKFACLLSFAERIGADYIATGHYARAQDGAIFRGHPENDQSYMLCRLTRRQIERLLLPLGDYAKREVRAMASQFGLPAADKPDSMEICFIPDNDYAAWLEARGICPPPGNFILHGQVIGRHEGIHRYTVGQRRGLGVYGGRRLYVSALRPETNEVILSLWEELFTTHILARDFSWLIDPPQAPIRASVRVRHTKWETPLATVTPCSGGVSILTDEPVRAPAPGQSAVLYDGDRLLGGGFITESLANEPSE